jgi:iron complex transport system substrate-binding protein
MPFILMLSIVLPAIACNNAAPDITAPYISGQNPADGAAYVPVGADIVVHIQDDGDGVDDSTITMEVEGTAVTPEITGTGADYTVTYDPSSDFEHLQVVDVTVDAEDLAGNAMSTVTYSFTAVGIPSQITDDLDRDIDIDGKPERVVSMAPSNTEILFALGLGDEVVGVSDFCNYPEEVNTRCDLEAGADGKITRVGNAFAANIEAIVALEPDIVIGFGYNLPGYVSQLEAVDIDTIVLAPEGMDGILDDIELIGSLMGVAEEANELTSQMTEDLAAITAETAMVSRPTVFCETGYGGGIWTTGAGSFVSNLIMLAGGTDIGVAVPSGFPSISLETITLTDPDMIILGDSPWETATTVKARGGAWDSLTAVQNDKIYDIDADVVSRNGPRAVEGIMALLAIIHPDIYAELQS